MASAESSVLRDDGYGLRVVDAIDQRVCGETSEDYGVRGSDSGAGQHRDGQLGHHAHVDGYSITFLDVQRFQDVCEFRYFDEQLLICKGSRVAGLAFPDQRRLILAPGFDVAIEAVV